MMVIVLVSKKDNDSSTLTAKLIDDSNKRDFYLAVLDDAINNLHYKATNGRIRDVKKEKLKVDMYRALFYGVNVANAVYRDKQIDLLVDDFEKLKKGLLIKDADNKISGNDAVEISDAELNDLIDFDERIKKLKDKDAAVGGE